MQARITKNFIKALPADNKPFEVVDTDIKGFLLRVQPTGRKIFYFSYRNMAGKRQRIKIGVLGNVSLTQARDVSEKYAGDVAYGKDPQAHKKKTKVEAAQAEERTLGAFLENQYKPWVLANRKSGQATLERLQANFDHLMHLPLHGVGVSVVEQWRTLKLKAGRKPSTINRSVVSLRAVLSKAVEWEQVEEHPLSKLKRLHEDSHPNARYLSEEEEKRLLVALAQRDNEIKDARKSANEHRAERDYPLLPDLSRLRYADRVEPMVLLALKTGLRRGELFGLRWSDIHLDKNYLTVRGDISKSQRTRHLPLSPTAYKVLEAWKLQCPEPDGLVFPGATGKPLSNMKSSWRTVLEKAGIERFRWHDMRHDFASKLVMKGVPLNTVRELCGHADMATTLRYAHLAPDHKADAIALLG